MDSKLFDDDAYELKETHSRWLIQGEVGVGFKIKDTVLNQELKANFPQLNDAWEILQILDKYESAGEYKG